MESLPRDVVLQVFSLLPAADLVQNVAGVCREWRALASDPDAWRARRIRLSVRPHQALSATERRLLGRTPALHALALSLRRSEDLPAPLSELLPLCSHLRELRLTLPCLTGQLMADVRIHWPRLQDLRVDATHIDQDAFQEISRLPHLQRLHVSALQGCDWEGLQQLSCCAALRALHLDTRCPGGPDNGPARLVEALADRLIELHLGTFVPASDSLFAAVGKCFKFPVIRLRRLHAEDCSGLSDAGLESLCLPLAVPLAPESLCLRKLDAVSTGALYRFIYRSDLSRLQLLQLPACPALTDQALYLLARRCPRLPTVVADDCPRVTRRCYKSLWGESNETTSDSAVTCGARASGAAPAPAQQACVPVM